MQLFEFYSPQNDKSEIHYQSDTRKPRITFEKLSKLRRLRDARKEENKKHEQLIAAMYGMPAEEGEGMGGGFGDLGGGGGGMFGAAPGMGGMEDFGDEMEGEFDMGDEGDFDLDTEVDMGGGDDFDLDTGEEV